MNKIKNSNKLIFEKSPYLLQHAYNPVDWHAWNEKTLKRAMMENKPVFLSVGYSTCYWCHVMEREVFENEEIAKVMNANFINIKVDREERPDIDRIYMQALQSMTGSGGWPMNMFLTPDLKPFYGATYIPPKAKYGRSGFEDIISQIINLWNDKRNDVLSSSSKITEIISERLELKTTTPADKFDTDALNNAAYEQINNLFDEEYGGFGKGNKFPRPVLLNYLLYFRKKFEEYSAEDMLSFTLKKMYEGGIYDNLAGGFHRYSVDYFWRVPHFEKMLYDQGQLAHIYFDAYSYTKVEDFLKAGNEILNYVTNCLTSPEGGFYSAEDAESVIDTKKPDVKKEGAFYLWTKEEIEDAVGKNISEIICFHYGVEYHGNTINDPHDVFGKSNVLFKSFDIFDTAKKFEKTPEEISVIIESAKLKLLKKRSERPAPFLDDKILTSWNSLMIKGFIRGFEITENDKFLKSAIRAADFIIGNMYDKTQKILFHRYRGGEVRFRGTIDDYALFTEALINLYEATFDIKYLKSAIEINDLMTDKFYDDEQGGFFDTEKNEADIIIRTKQLYDGAEPAGSTVAIINLLKLAVITENKGYKDKAEKSLELYYSEVEKNPFSYPNLLMAFNLYEDNFKEIILTGTGEDNELEESAKFIRKYYIPGRILLNGNKEMTEISEFIKNTITDNNNMSILICENFKCNLPINSYKELLKINI